MSNPNCSSYPVDNCTVLEYSVTEVTERNATRYEIFFDIYIYRILHYIFGSVGFMLNVGTLIAILLNTDRKLQLTFLASLTLSDMVIAVLSIFYYDICFESLWPLLDECQVGKGVDFSTLKMKYVRYILGSVYTISQCAGILTLYAITIDILCAVSKPLYYRHCNTYTKAKWLVVSIWLLSFFAVFVEGFISMYPFDKNFKEQFTISAFRPLLMIFSSFSLLPFVIMYSVTICNIWRHVSKSPSRQSRNMTKAAVTLILIMGTYFLCMTPAVWILILVSKTESTSWTTEMTFLHSFHVLYVCNTVLDPLIYAIRIPEVRQYFKRFFGLSCTASLSKRNTPTQLMSPQ